MFSNVAFYMILLKLVATVHPALLKNKLRIVIVHIKILVLALTVISVFLRSCSGDGGFLQSCCRTQYRHSYLRLHCPGVVCSMSRPANHTGKQLLRMFLIGLKRICGFQAQRLSQQIRRGTSIQFAS